jgi:hypothetical protein
MAKVKRQRNMKGPEAICRSVDKFEIIIALKALIEESGSIAKYINDTAKYGRILGYAEGRLSAYIEIVDRILEGNFDSNV